MVKYAPMPERRAGIRRIPAKDVRQFAEGAAKRRKDTRMKNPLWRLNHGFEPLDEATGELSTRPTDKKEGNRAPFHPAETNVAGASVEYEGLTERILNSGDPNEISRLETVRDSLKVQELKPTATGITAEGNFEREVPATQKFTYIDPETKKKQIFRYALYNWNKLGNGKPVTVSFPTYNIRVDKNSTASIRDAELAAQMPDRPMIAIMHPGMGSGRLTKKQLDELRTDKSYFSIADAQLQLIKSLGIGKDDMVNVVGLSMGSFAGLAFAARATKDDFKLHRLALTSLPGVEERNFTELVKAMKDSGKDLAPAWTGPFNPDIYQSRFLHRSVMRQALEGISWAGSSLVNDPLTHWFPYVHALAEDTAADRILQVLRKHTDSQVTLLAGTEDQVSRRDAVYSTLKRVHEGGFGRNRVGALYLPEDTHAVGENPFQYAGNLQLALQ